MRIVRTALAALVVMLAVSAVAAQSGGLTVLVADSNGPLPGATVTISHEAGYIKTTSELTNANGVVQFPVLRPGGGYRVEVSFPGFSTRRIDDVHIKINDNFRLTVQLAEEIVERVKVTAEGDVVDLEDTTQSNKFSEEFVQDLPVPGRFYQNVLTLAPGVQDSDGDGNPNVHGSRNRDFKTEVGGVANVDPLTGQWMSRVNPNSIEEMEVITAGAGVEFSRAQGGFARVIQKQGSNEFEGVAEMYYRSSKLDGDGAGDFSNLPDLGFNWYQPSAQVSGPIVKDKLWYRLSHEKIDQEIPVNVVSGIAITTVNQGIHSDAITWQVSPRNKLQFQFQSDPLTVDNFGISSLVGPDSAQKIKRSGNTYTLSWTAPFSPKVLVKSSVAWQDLNTGRFPQTEGVLNNCVRGVSFLETAQCSDLVNNTVSGSAFRTFDDHRQRLSVRSDATVYGGNFLGMQHQFQVGLLIENERYFRNLTRKPNVFHYQVSLEDPGAGGTPERQDVILSRVAIPQTARVRATGTNWGIYGEDQVKPRQNVTVTLGLRIDREEINSIGYHPLDTEGEFQRYQDLLPSNPSGNDKSQTAKQVFTAYESIEDFVQQLAVTLNLNPSEIDSLLSVAANESKRWAQKREPENVDITNTNYSPFLGVSWDPWSNGKTKFAVTMRRYYDKVYLNVPLIELEPATTDIVWNVDREGEGFTTVTGRRNSINPAVNISTVDRNLRTPYQDEFQFQFERELWAETSFRFSYINRKFRDQFQDTDLNHVPGDFGRCKWATLTSPSTVVPVLVGDDDYVEGVAPGDGVLDDCAGDIEVPLNQETGQWERDQVLQRPDGRPDLYIQNPAWGEIYLVSNSNLIDYEGYVFEIIRRQYRSWEMQASYTWSKAKGDGEDFNQSLGDDRSLLEDEKGFQSYDQRHVVKVNATTITPWGFRLGGAITWQSGLPYSILNQKLAFDATPPTLGDYGGGSTRSRQQYVTGRRNDQRNVPYWNVDMKLTKEMNVGRGLNLQFSAEIFNLLNDGTYLVYNPATETGQQINGRNVSVRRFGRQWQLGVKMAF